MSPPTSAFQMLWLQECAATHASSTTVYLPSLLLDTQAGFHCYTFMVPVASLDKSLKGIMASWKTTELYTPSRRLQIHQLMCHFLGTKVLKFGIGLAASWQF